MASFVVVSTSFAVVSDVIVVGTLVVFIIGPVVVRPEVTTFGVVVGNTVSDVPASFVVV